MKYLVSLSVLLFSIFSYAQTVQRVSGKDVLISADANQTLNEGDQIHFLDSTLSKVGEGKVVKISGGGSKALVQLTLGKAAVGMTAEVSGIKKASATSMKQPVNTLAYSSLTEEDKRILADGEISTGTYVVGGILGTWPLGLGIGHAVQGRYSEKGWIFTVGELGSIAVLAAGLGTCWDSASSSYKSCSGGLVYVGAVGFLAFRIWEIVDVWATPPEHNRRYRELKSRLGETITFQPALVPLADGAMLGFQLKF